MPAQSRRSQAPPLADERELHSLYTWLNSRAMLKVSGPLHRDIESRAVDHLFVNWVMHRSNEDLSVGYMDDLPDLFLGAARESILWYIVRATALADMKQQRGLDDVSFARKALQYYGAALRKLRNVAEDEENLANDSVLAAVLLVDSFEVRYTLAHDARPLTIDVESMYLGRIEPLGPHTAAVKYILRARGDKQFQDISRFGLWRVAHERLQARQMFCGEEPDREQVGWVCRLDTAVINLHVSSDIHRINMLTSAASKLTLGGRTPEVEMTKKVQHATALATDMLNLIISIENWTEATNENWKPELIDLDLSRSRKIQLSSAAPVLEFRCPQMLSYRDIWQAYICNFHLAGQIVLREALIGVVNFRSALQAKGWSLADMELTASQYRAIEKLSSSIGRSMPQLLGFARKDIHPPHALPQGKIAGRYFCLFSMAVIQHARFTSHRHKEAAVQVIEWIQRSCRLP